MCHKLGQPGVFAAVSAGDLRMSFLFNPWMSSRHSDPVLRIIEMQVIAATLLENFEFSLPPQTSETQITRKPLVLMVPMVEGRQYPWMGLRVRCLD
jgi:hypothetical protein